MELRRRGYAPLSTQEPRRLSDHYGRRADTGAKSPRCQLSTEAVIEPVPGHDPFSV